MDNTAREVGHDLLKQVETCNLDDVRHHDLREDDTLANLLCLKQLLRDLRDLRSAVPASSTSTPHIFGVASLDALLCPRPTNDTPRYDTRAPVVELVSARVADDTISFIYHAVAHAVLPISSGGKGGTAVLVDCDGQTDVFHLARTVEIGLTWSKNNGESEVPSNVEQALEHALRQVHILHAASLESLTAALSTLSSYLLKASLHSSATRQVELLAIHNLTNFYWNERAAQEEAKYETPMQDEGDYVPRPDGHLRLSRAINSLRRTFASPVLATMTGLTPTSNPGIRPVFKQMLPTTWTDMLTCRVGVQRETVTRFPGGYSVEEAESDREKRSSVVNEGRYGM